MTFPETERSSSTYQAARAAAHRVYPHFARHPVPEIPQATIERIIDTAFWASLRREEGFTPRISLAFVSPERLSQPVIFERPIPLAPQPLTRLAPAVERPGIHLGVSCEGDDFYVWGATRDLPAYCFVLEVVGPGLLVIKHSRGKEPGKFVNVAVLQGDEVKIVDQRAATEPDCPALLTSLLGFESQYASVDSVNLLIQLAVSMRAHNRGGSLLVVPPNSDAWRESVVRPMTYGIAPRFAGLAELVQEDPANRQQRHWQDAVRRSIDGIAGLTAVDGATVINSQYELLAFGVKIIRRKGQPQVETIVCTEPVEGSVAEIVEPALLGGTRHMSAAQFAQDQQDAIALIASQDGRFTVFAWSPREETVHAHRIEALLL